MPLRRPARPFRTLALNALVGAAAVAAAFGARAVPGHAEPGPVLRAASGAVGATPRAAYLTAAARTTSVGARVLGDGTRRGGAETAAALSALASEVRRLSHPEALADAFHSYYAYRAARPDEAAKPYLYFVDYGLPSTEPRGYVFDMAALRVVDGPFMVAHGRGSDARDGVPRRFSNAFGSQSTSLGLYVAQELYAFRGTSSGRAYRSVGLRLAGVSGAFNSLARARGVVAHGAPYVTPSRAGRSEGCPAVEPGRAQRLLPMLAHGGLVFLFAPDARWMASDPWLAADAADAGEELGAGGSSAG